jgi:hypothetical protein
MARELASAHENDPRGHGLTRDLHGKIEEEMANSPQGFSRAETG